MTTPATPIGGADEEVKEFSQDGAEVTFKFKRLSQYNPGESWIHMVYGPSKTGKTFYAGTAGPRTLFVNIGEGLETLMAPSFTRLYPDAKNMIVVDVREITDKAMAFDKVTDAIDHALKHFPNKFDTVVLDEATALRKFAMNKAMELNTAARSNTIRGKRTEEFVVPEIGDYGREMQIIEWFLGTYIPLFKEHGKHFLMLAHERQTFGKPPRVGDEPVLKRVLPGFTGKTFPDQIPAFFDDVFHSEAVGAGTNTVYRLRTAGSEIEIGGARHGGIFSVTETNPSFLKMLDKIKLATPLPTRR